MLRHIATITADPRDDDYIRRWSNGQSAGLAIRRSWIRFPGLTMKITGITTIS